ncbi:Ig-like domain-containing protein [uncultured Methanobrevibacter sp.]|uniref:Ig-like domain-containing protein n=1 Tax=uncultured Methanobrevibacter sp. TaxID=253161 RepID=UPI0025FABF86|nr:Ig-like domain-containing protein [uncultured Methanobrevibacter sp.]
MHINIYTLEIQEETTLKHKKIMILATLLVGLLAISTASASENVTDNAVSVDDSAEVVDLTDDDVEQEYDSDNYQPRIIPQGYTDDEDIPQEINYTLDYDDYDGYYISIIDEDGYNIPDLNVRLIDIDTNNELMTFDYEEDEDSYWCNINTLGAGKHSCRIIVDDSYYDIKPIDLNLEVGKAYAELNLKEIYVVKGDYAIIKAEVTDIEDDFISGEGKVKFTVNGKTYKRSVNDEGIATLKVKMNKLGTFTYSAKYTGSENYNPSFTEKSKIHVLSASKSARTISIKGYKAVISLYKYKKLINAKNTGKTYVYKVGTGKTIKQVVDIIDKNTYERTTKTVKSKVFFYIAYDGTGYYTGSLPANQYVAELTTSNQHRYGNIICHKWLFGYKQAKVFSKLNSSKVRQRLYGL